MQLAVGLNALVSSNEGGQAKHSQWIGEGQSIPEIENIYDLDAQNLIKTILRIIVLLCNKDTIKTLFLRAI